MEYEFYVTGMKFHQYPRIKYLIKVKVTFDE